VGNIYRKFRVIFDNLSFISIFNIVVPCLFNPSPHMRIFLSIILIHFVSFDAQCALKVKESIGFEINSTLIDQASQEILDTLISQFPDYLVEKIDIVGHCSREGEDDYNLLLSRKRSIAVYNYMTAQFPDIGAYQVKYFGEQLSPFLFGDEQSRCVRITVYLLERNVTVASVNLTSFLFPEESNYLLDHTALTTKMAPAEAKPLFQFIPADVVEKKTFSIEAIYFHGNSAIYKDESDPSLTELANFLKHYRDISIRLEGHVNGKMGRGYLKRAGKSNPERKIYKNAKELSLARAENVKEFLVFEGIFPDRISCVGKGGSEMLYPHAKNNMQHEANRRIEVVILD
jgi:outer membrane protein OmpA-like peptidoglycan-associated protein